jgi:hypothetical protein
MIFLPLRYWIKTAIEDITFFLLTVPVHLLRRGGRRREEDRRPEIIGVY